MDTIVGLIIVVMGFTSMFVLALGNESAIVRRLRWRCSDISRALSFMVLRLILGKPAGDKEVYYDGVRGVCGQGGCSECSYVAVCEATGFAWAEYDKRQRDLICEFNIFGIAAAVKMAVGLAPDTHTYKEN